MRVGRGRAPVPILTLADLATAGLRGGKLPADACRHAITVAELLHRIGYATGAARLYLGVLAAGFVGSARCATSITTT